MLIVINKSTLEKNLSRLPKTIKRHFKFGGAFLTSFKGTFRSTNKNTKF